MIPSTFLQHAADILGDTNSGYTGPKIGTLMTGYAAQFNVQIPYHRYPFGTVNKRTALYENLRSFQPEHQYQIIKELCENEAFAGHDSAKVKKLKLQLVTRYSHLAAEASEQEINESLIEETRHWLDGHQQALQLFNAALEKFENRIFVRNLLDDLRLSLERLLRDVLGNSKSLENQVSHVGSYIEDRGGSKELANMFVKLLDYYTKYQNNYVKHDDAVIEEEIEFIFEITSSFMKHLIRLGAR